MKHFYRKSLSRFMIDITFTKYDSSGYLHYLHKVNKANNNYRLSHKTLQNHLRFIIYY